MQAVESVYIFIWQWINQASRDQQHFEDIINVKNVRKVVLNEIWGLFEKYQLEILCGKETEPKTIEKCFQNLVDAKWLDAEGRIVVEPNNCTEISLKKLVPCEIDNLNFKKISFFFQEQISRPRIIKIPINFEKFVLLHLESWIKSGVRAMFMEDERQYIIDSIVSPSERHANPSPIIIDLDTGADQPNSQWNETLHQFVQLKHGCRLSLQTLKSVFISNVSYFKLYTNLFGMSGTLGSLQEQEGFKKIHNVDFMTIPTFRPKQFTEMEPLMAEDSEEFLKKVCEQAKKMAENRVVLMICETIKDVNLYFKEIASKDNLNVIPLRREADALNAKLENLASGTIIIATNLAGRGMNLKLAKEVIEAGGLHVLVTCLPPNIRIEQQALGRAARSGEPGSGQICVDLKGSKCSIFELKQERNKQEIKRLQSVEQFYTKFIKVEESLFTLFNAKFQTISESDEERRILKSNFLNSWSFWLDENSQKLEDEDQEKLEKSLNAFIEQNDCENPDWKSLNIQKASKIHYAIHDAKKPNLKILSQVSALDVNHNLVESYYKFYAEHKNTSRQLSITNDGIFKSFGELRRIRSCFEARKNQRLLQLEMLKPVIQKNKNKLLQTQGLTEQCQMYARLDNIFVDSINKILGHPISPEVFDNILMGNESLCTELYEKLLYLEVLTKPKLHSNIPVEKCVEIAIKNVVRPEKLVEFVKMYEGKSFNMKTISNELKIKVAAPSRENFWDILVNNGELVEEKKFMSFNKLKLEKVDPSFLELLEEDLKEEQVKIEPSATEVFLHNLENIELFELTFNAETLKFFDSNLLESLKEKGCLSVNKLAKFEKNIGNVQFNENLHIDDFKIVKISSMAAMEIIENLLQDEFLEKKSEKSYKLNGSFQNFELIKLGKENDIYTNAVLQLLHLCFPYQIAYQRLCSDVKNAEDNIVIKLYSNSHLNILADFCNNGFVEPSRVGPSKSTKIGDLFRFSNVLNSEDIVALQDKIIPKQKLDVVNLLVSEKVISDSPADEYIILKVKEKDSSHKAYKTLSSLKLLLQNKRILHEKRKEIVEFLECTVSTWFNRSTEDPELVLKPIDDFVEDMKRYQSEELQVVKNSGLSMVVMVKEKTYTFAVKTRFFVILFIGFLQIIIGALITFYSAGMLTHVGSGLLSEGIGDLMFACSSFKSGHFTWADYRKHKAISLAFTVATCGLGAYLSRGKTAVGYGFKYAGETLTKNGLNFANMTGMELFKNLPIGWSLKEIGKIIVKSTYSAAINYLSARAISYIMNQTLLNTIKSLASEFTGRIKDKLKSADIQNVLKSLFNIHGKTKLLHLIRNIVNNRISEKREIRKVFSTAFQVCELVNRHMKNHESSSVSSWFKNFSTAISLIKNAEIFISLATYNRTLINNVKSDLEIEMKANKNEEQTDSEVAWEVVETEIAIALRDPIQNDVTSIINEKVVSPLLNLMTNKLVSITEKYAEKAYDYGIRQYCVYKFDSSAKVLEELNKLTNPTKKQESAIEKHENKLTKLMASVNDPKLMADLMRRNTQMNMLGVQGAAKILPKIVRMFGNRGENFLITVEHENGDVYTFGTPGGREIALKLKDNHFENNAEGAVGNDCLFHALWDQIPELGQISSGEFRETVANCIENDHEINFAIKMGWHTNTMRRGAYGGRVVSNNPMVSSFMDSRKNIFTAGIYDDMIKPKNFGGSKKHDPSTRVATVEMNHVPPKSVYPGYKPGDRGSKLPAMVMAYDDHQNLGSSGSSTESQKYRADLKVKMSEGDWVGVLTMEISDIQTVAGANEIYQTNYDIGLSQLLRVHQDSENISDIQATELRKQFNLPTGYMGENGWVQL